MTEQKKLKKQEDAFWSSPLDEEEQWYEDHADEFIPCENQEELRQKLIEAAKQPPSVRRPKKPVTIRIDDNDIGLLKAKAAEQGLQYQSLVCSILHRYALGTLVDVTEARKIMKM